MEQKAPASAGFPHAIKAPASAGLRKGDKRGTGGGIHAPIIPHRDVQSRHHPFLCHRKMMPGNIWINLALSRF